MSAGLVLVYVFVISVLSGALVFLWLKQQQIAQREAFQSLAARRGWALTVTEQKLGKPAILRLTSRSGTGWHAETRLDAGDQNGQARILATEFYAAYPQWPDGSLVLTLATQDEGDRGSQDLSEPDLVKRVSQFIPDGIVAQLQSFVAPSGLTVRATVDPLFRFDLPEIAKTTTSWQPQRRGTDGQPVILIGAEGFRVRLGHGMRRADEMEKFIDFALEIIRVM